METCHYLGYVIRLQKDRLQAKRKILHEEMCMKKLAKKRCPGQLKLSCSLKTFKKSESLFSNNQKNAHYCDTWKRKPKPTKMGDMQKSQIF